MKRRGSPACLSLTMREGGSALPSSRAEPRAMAAEEEMIESERVWRKWGVAERELGLKRRRQEE